MARVLIASFRSLLLNGTLTTIERRGLWILSSIVLLSRSAFALLNDRLLYGGPFCDDAYYALSVARHLAIGQGFTSDGIHLTNGFQPLNTLLQSCCFFLANGSRVAGLRLTYVLAALIEVAFLWSMAFLIASMRRERNKKQRWWQSPILIAAFFQSVLYRLLLIHTNGLETALTAVLIILALSEYGIIVSLRTSGTVPRMWRMIRFGVLCGFLVLARIDTAVFVAIVAFLELRAHRKKIGRGIRNAVVVGGIALLISLPWWIFNLLAFGNLMPMSGQSESFHRWSVFSFLDAADFSMNILFFWIPKVATLLPRWPGFILYLLILLLSAWTLRRAAIFQRIRLHYDLHALTPLWLFGIFLFFYYLFIFRATWFLERFWHPMEIGWIILVSIALSELSKWLQSRTKRVRRWSAVVAAIVILWAGAMNVRWDRSLYLPYYPVDLADLGFWVEAHPGTKLGALQSGEAGFISDNVINLDGKVNADALHARQHDSLGAYIRSERFDYLGDEALTIDLALRDSARFDYHCTFVDSIRSIRIYRVSYP